MLTDTGIEDEIRSTLLLDERIPDAAEIAVTAEDGVVTLRGTVGSFAQRRAAAKDARSVEGVYEVADDLQVRLLDEARCEDADLRGIALQVLMWDVEVPAESLEVKVDEGWVTVKGIVSYQFQSDAVYEDVATLPGVVGITNEVKVISP